MTEPYFNPPFLAPADPTTPHRFRYLYGLTPTSVWAHQLPSTKWHLVGDQGHVQVLADQCFRDRYRLDA
jgi:hypothetical protein